MKKRIILKIIFIILFIFFLISCGGGGTSSKQEEVSVIPVTIDPQTSQGSIKISSISTKNAIFVVTAHSYTLPNPTYSLTAEIMPSAKEGFISYPFLSKTKESFDMDFHTILRLKEIEFAIKYGSPLNYPLPKIKKKVHQQGEFVNFWVEDNYGRNTQITAELKVIGEHCYIYLDTGNDTIDLPIDVIETIKNEFDNNSYPTAHNYFGTEWNPGIDNDNRITILISALVPAYGYFYARDEFPNTIPGFGYSNMREMIYLNDGIWVEDDINEAKATLIHEFQHMINFYYKTILYSTFEEIWLNEGLSVYAEQLAGYGMLNGSKWGTNMVLYYLEAPQDFSISYWNPKEYGMSYLHVLYIAEHFGDNAIKSLVQSDLNGIENVEAATNISFDNYYNNWTLANYLDGMVKNKEYNYYSIDLRGTYAGISLSGIVPAEEFSDNNYNFTTQRSLNPWGVEYLEFVSDQNGKDLSLNITANQGAKLNGYLIIINNP
ncbi:MAG: hypothetical protein JRI44_01855 [Deltaproteobacteria bacterium]|nr:hypothetical protein [Deltaproteobacteria bacterium]